MGVPGPEGDSATSGGPHLQDSWRPCAQKRRHSQRIFQAAGEISGRYRFAATQVIEVIERDEDPTVQSVCALRAMINDLRPSPAAILRFSISKASRSDSSPSSRSSGFRSQISSAASISPTAGRAPPVAGCSSMPAV